MDASPQGWVAIGRWDIAGMPRAGVAAILALSAVALAAAAAVGSGVAYLGTGNASVRLDLAGVLAGAALGPALHELVHAAAFLALGGRPRFGARLRTRLGPVLYVAAPGYRLRRGAYLAAALAPAAGLTAALWAVLALAPEGGALAAFAFAAACLNAAGSAGDAAMALAALRQPAGLRFEDTGDGFTVWGPPPAGASAAPS